MTTLRALRPFVRASGPAPGERCELCAAVVDPDRHRHVLDISRQKPMCVCRACALLFTQDAGRYRRYRTVPERVRHDSELSVDDAGWAALGIPVGLAFLFYRSEAERWVACYPSPAGPTESELPARAVGRLEGLPVIGELEPDVEALLVRRPRGGGPIDCFLAPIDVCYELVALVRSHFRGFDGGDEARSLIDAFFAGLRERSRPLERGASS